MMTNRNTTWLWCLGIALIAACGGSEGPADGEDRNPPAPNAASVAGEAPEVEERYQERVNRAWSQASEGRNPASTCSGLRARVSMTEAGSGDRALIACGIDVPIRYYTTLIDRVDAGEKSCVSFMTDFTTSIRAMTASPEGLATMARQAQRGDVAEPSSAAAARASTAIVADAAGGQTDQADPRQPIRDALRERVSEVCPAEAPVILR